MFPINVHAYALVPFIMSSIPMSRHSALFCRRGKVGRLRFRSDDNGLFIRSSPDSRVATCCCLRAQSFSPVSAIPSSSLEEAIFGRLVHREDASSSSIICRTWNRDFSDGGEKGNALLDRCLFEELWFLPFGTPLLNWPLRTSLSTVEVAPEEYSCQRPGVGSLEPSRSIVQFTVFIQISNNSLCIPSF